MQPIILRKSEMLLFRWYTISCVFGRIFGQTAKEPSLVYCGNVTRFKERQGEKDTKICNTHKIQIYIKVLLHLAIVHETFKFCCDANRPFAGPGHVTYSPLNLKPGTLRVPEMKRSGKK